MSNYTTRIPKPAPQDVNSGLSAAKQSTMRTLFGPAWKGTLGTDCGEVNDDYKKFVVTKDCGPFRVTGNGVFLMLVSRALNRLFYQKPDLYRAVGTAGCLCPRLIRGSNTTPSNHSWGTAIDLTISGELDDRGDNMCQSGLLALYPFMHEQGLYWGTEFPTEDSMHFEMADETMWKLALAGEWGPAVQARAKIAKG